MARSIRGIDVAWSDDQRGTRYALVMLGAGYNTLELWLVTVSTKGTRTRNLSPEANKAVKDYVRKREPRANREYAIFYSQSGQYHGGDGPLKVAGKSVTNHFDVGNPRYPNDDGGNITFSLPQGTVASVSKE